MYEDVPKLRITSSMSLEQAMLEVRRYLAAKSTTAGDQVRSTVRHRTPAQFNTQIAIANRLSEIATRLGQIEPHSKFGAPGVFLKRIVGKAIGWYSRPAHEFDRAALELLQQIRQDMAGLQQQIVALQEQRSGDISPQPALTQSRDQSERREVVLLMIELFKNVTAVQSLRQALRAEDPELLRQVDILLDRLEGESQELRAALRRSLNLEEH